MSRPASPCEARDDAIRLAALIEAALLRPAHLDPSYAGALWWVNFRRARLGEPPLPALLAGVIDHPGANPLARSLGPGSRAERWWAHVLHRDGRWAAVAMPPAPELFLERFHFGLYPALTLPRLELVQDRRGSRLAA